MKAVSATRNTFDRSLGLFPGIESSGEWLCDKAGILTRRFARLIFEKIVAKCKPKKDKKETANGRVPLAVRKIAKRLG